MAEPKKISFGFSKLVKPKVPILSTKKDVKSEDSVQYIDCLEEKSIKVKNAVPIKDDVLVIPLPKDSVASGKRRELLHKILNNLNEDDVKPTDQTVTPPVNVSTNQDTSKPETLDELAAREIIEDLKKVNDIENNKDNFTVPLIADETTGKESTADDYESIPVEQFGVAMLRGMGWAPGKGVGKTEQVVNTKQPLLRPKGLGLGADKVMQQQQNSNTGSEPLKLVKGSFVRIIAGVHQDTFGEIIGFDDESGRLIVKMALGSNTLTFNEFMVEVVSKDDFHKNSKVINVKKYEEYKKKEDAKGVVENPNEIESSKYKSASNTNESDDDSSNVVKSKIKDKHTSNKSRKSITPEVSPDVRYHDKSNTESRRLRRSRSSSSSSRERKYKSSRRKKDYRSSSSEQRTPPRKIKHASRKESRRRRSSSDTKTHSYQNEKKKKSKHRSRSTSSDSSSDYKSHGKHSEYYKKKCKKHKEKKKSKRNRSRSVSFDRKHTSNSKKHKKSKY